MADIHDLRLAEQLRAAIGAFVRKTREGAGTPSNARSETLGLLSRNGALSVAALARMRAVTHQSMRETVADLAKEGLVRSKANPEDGRGKLYNLTSRGKQVLRDLRHARADWIAERWVCHLDEDERRTIVQAIALLGRIDKL